MKLIRLGHQIGLVIFLAGCSIFGVASQESSFNVREILDAALESNKGHVDLLAIPVDPKNNEKMIKEKLSGGLLLSQPDVIREEIRANISGGDSPTLHLGLVRLVYANSDDLKSAQGDFSSEGFFGNSKILTPYRSASGIRVLCVAYSETYLHPQRDAVFAELLRHCVDS